MSSSPPLCALKLRAEAFHAPPVHAKVRKERDPRRGADVHHPALGMEAKFDVVDEAQPASADRMEIVFRCREDGRARHGSQESPQPAEKGGAVSRHDERLDPVPGRRVVPAAHASGGKRCRGRAVWKRDPCASSSSCIQPASVVSHKYAYESAGPFGRRLRTSLRA